MAAIEEEEVRPEGLSRRQALRRGAAVTAVVWAAPVVTSVGLSRAGAATTSAPCTRTFPFSDGFEAEPCAFGTTVLTNFTVAPGTGTVDVVVGGPLGFIGPCFGIPVTNNNTKFLDLDGTPPGNGLLVLNTCLRVTAGRTYTLTFDLAGNNRGAAGTGDSVRVTFGPTGGLFLRNTLDPFSQETLAFTAGTNGPLILTFQEQGIPDAQGILLDNVLITETP